MAKGIKILLFFYCISYPFFSQSQEIKFEHVSTEDGLSSNMVNCIIQDSSGFMWFGTSEGLNRWDGYNFETFLSDSKDSSTIFINSINDLYIDPNGNMWVGTSNGLNKFDYGTKKFKRYKAPHKDSDQSPLDVIKDIIEDNNGVIWCATMYGLCKLDSSDTLSCYIPESGNTNLLSSNYIYSLYQIDTNTILLGTNDGLLEFNIETNTFTKIPFNNVFFDRSPAIHKIYKDRSGQLWLGMAGRDIGLLKYDYKDRSFKQYRSDPSDPTTLSHSVIMSIYEDLSGNLWVGTSIGGLNLLNRSKDQFQSFQHNSLDEKSIGSQWIQEIYEDNDHNLWFGTEDNGVSYVVKYRKPVIHFEHNTEDSSTLASGVISAICEDKQGDLWIAHWGGGVSRLKKGSRKFIRYGFNSSQKISISNEWVSDIYEDKEGQIWVGSMGLDRINPKTNNVVHYKHDVNNPNSLNGIRVYTIYEDNKQRLWLGMWDRGLELFDRNQGIFKHFRHNPNDSMSLCHDVVSSIYQDSRNILWIGTVDGLCRLDPSKTNKVEFITYKNDQNKIGTISNNVINKIFEDSKNRLWIGTENGLNLFNYKNESFTCFKTEDGLPSNCIYAILEDDSGNLWLRMEKKLVKYNVENNTFRIYDESDGFPDYRVTPFGYKAFQKGRSGKFYYAGQKSLNYFYPDSIKDNTNPPPIVLIDFKLKNKSVEINDSSYLKKDINYVGSIALPYHENIFSIEFAALDYTTPAKNQYAYKLKGFHDDWTYTDANHRVASYTNLDPGEYTFKVIGSNCDGVWNKVGASVNIIILPPWWATWWFRSVAIIFLAAFIYGIYRYRVNKLLEMERMRVQIATDLHDDVGASLTKIAVHSEIIQSTEDRKKIASSSAKIGNMSREIITSLSDIIWSIDARNDKVGDLIDRMRDYLETIFPIGNISTDLQTHGLKFDNNLDQVLRQNIYLIFKEAVNNAAKHSCATKVNINMTNGDGKFKLEINDNGKGIELNEKSSGFHGLQNMKLRAERIGGELKTENNNGTRIILTVKEI